MADSKEVDLKGAIQEIEKVTRSGDLDAAMDLIQAYWKERKAGAKEPMLYSGDTFVLTVHNRIVDKQAAENA